MIIWLYDYLIFFPIAILCIFPIAIIFTKNQTVIKIRLNSMKNKPVVSTIDASHHTCVSIGFSKLVASVFQKRTQLV